MNKQWIHKTYDHQLQRDIAYSVSLHPVTAALLINRDITGESEIKTFLSPSMDNLADPLLIPGIPDAVKRINTAIQNRESILIYGDYDVDGISATALFILFFRLFDIECSYYIPNRITESYSLSKNAIDEVHSRNINLIITVDCGISSIAEIEYANSLGMDVIVTDHHSYDCANSALPDACAIVNPAISSDPAVFKYYSGVGVAFNLVWAIFQSFSRDTQLSTRFADFLSNSISLVTLGTIADIVPLIGENRTLVSYGLSSIKATTNVGIQQLLKTAGILNQDKITSRHISFRVAPMMNAGGRMEDASIVVKLLISNDEEEANEITKQLRKFNTQRKEIEGKIFDEAVEEIESSDIHKNSRVIVVAREGWHQGVIGIVASRLIDKYGKPAVVVSLVPSAETAKGSARSTPEFHIHNAFSKLSELFYDYGGHAQAAGMGISKHRIDELRYKINELAVEMLPQDKVKRTLNIDMELPIDHIDEQLYYELSMFEPYGRKNEEPVFSTQKVVISSPPTLNKYNGQLLTFYVNQNNSFRNVLGWNMQYLYDKIRAHKGGSVDIAYTLHYNSYHREVELSLKDIIFH